MRFDPLTRSLLWLLVYYAVLVAGTLFLERRLPLVRDAVSFELQSGITQRQLRRTLEAGGEPAAEGGAAAEERPSGALRTALAMAGVLLLVIPVARIYMLTKQRQRWDPSVVQTVILLPLAIAGIVAVVRNSLALAFSLAGLAAAVRFRNTLKDTKDAVYIFLAVAVGLAAGVQALALGFVVSVIFNAAVLGLWLFNVGGIYAGEPRPSFTGEFRVRDPERLDGLLVVRATAAGPAQEIVEATLHDLARAWKLTQRVPGEGGRATLTYQVRLKKKTSPAALVAAVTARAAPHGVTADFQSPPPPSLSDLRWQVPSAARLEELLQAPLPLGLRGRPARLSFHRELYFDTPQGDLRRRGARCCVRFDVEDRRWLALDGAVRCEARVAELEPQQILLGASEPARRLRALVDPSRLEQYVELDVERRLRVARFPVLPVSQFVFAYDSLTVRSGASPELHELVLWRRPWALLPLAPLGRAVSRLYGLAAASQQRAERAAELRLGQAQVEEAATGAGRLVALLAIAHGRLALSRVGTELRLPTEEGGGEEACRQALRRAFGNAEGEVRLLGVVPAAAARPAVEVWLARRLRRDLSATPPRGVQWFPPAEIVARVGSPVLREPVTLAALAVASRSELVPEWSAAPLEPPEAVPVPGDTGSRLTLSELRLPQLPARALEVAAPAPEQFFNAHLSSLEFTARVLALAEDPGTPLVARLRFLAIVSTNLDQFFMVDVGALKHEVAAGVRDRSPDGLTPAEELDAIAIRVHPLVARQYRAFRDLPAHAIRIRDWSGLEPEERASLDRRFAEEVAALLTPKALTRAPGHPFPHAGDRQLSLAVTLRDEAGGPVHFASVELPAALPRFLPLAGGGVIPLEAVVRAKLATLFPGREVVEAHAFRVTRAGDIQLDDLATASFLQAVAEEVRRRPLGPVVRLEVERSMPPALRDLLQRELRFEESDLQSALGPSDVYEAPPPGLVDLGALGELAAADGQRGSDYPHLVASDPFAGARSVFDALDRGDVLVHHPYDSFAASVERFIDEAADDPGVAAIKLTLYRPGGPSAIGDALRRAAAAGKDVSVFVELKARFDEQLNIGWAQSLEAAGIHVVTGLATLKTHAKIALVVRRSDGGRHTRRYAHVGSGNYNPDTARMYTDLGLFTADSAIAEDLHRLFNELTGSSRPPQAEFRRLLVAPTNMLDRFLAMIAREADHARAGRNGRIRAKLNGLADATVIRALYRASQAGVAIDLVVRGICMLRPGVPGLSERIRVVSLLGRFLEHGRIYHFANAGAPEYYIGSADWRPRNLRRRVEVITPVQDPAARERLSHIVDRELSDPMAWSLETDGSYSRMADGPGRGARESTTRERASAPQP